MTAFVLAPLAATLPLIIAGWLAPTLMHTDDPPGGHRRRADPADAYQIRVRRYRTWTVAAGACVTACQVAAVATVHISTTTIARAGTGSVAWLFVLIWALVSRTRASAETGAYDSVGPAAKNSNSFPVRWLAPAVAVPVLTVAVGLLRFRDVPATRTVHWTANGVADRRVTTTMDTLFSLCTLQAMAAMTALMVIGYGWREGQRHARKPGPRRYLYRLTCGLLALAIGGQLSLTAASLILWRFLPPTGPGVAAVLVPISGGLGVLIILYRRHPGVDTTDIRQPAPI